MRPAGSTLFVVTVAMILLALRIALLGLIIAGAIARRRAAISILFVAYLCVGLSHKLFEAATGQTTWWIALIVDLVQQVLCLGAVVEIGLRAFHRGLPGGRQSLALRFLLVLVGGVGALLFWGTATPATAREWYDALLEGSRRVAATTAVAATVLLVFTAKRWVLDPWHRDVVMGIWLYRVPVMLLSPRPGEVPGYAIAWPPIVYALILGWWAYAAWRKDDDYGWSPNVLALVWPHRS